VTVTENRQPDQDMFLAAAGAAPGGRMCHVRPMGTAGAVHASRPDFSPAKSRAPLGSAYHGAVHHDPGPPPLPRERS